MKSNDAEIRKLNERMPAETGLLSERDAVRLQFFETIDLAPSGCLVWIGNTDTAGYGQFSFQGRLIPAHRMSWTLHWGHIRPIEDNEDVGQACGNRLCVHPRHLFVGPWEEDERDQRRTGT